MESSGGRFRDKVAVITGSTNGIGFATAKRLGEEGASVVVSSRKQENVTEAVRKLTESGIIATGVVCHQGVADDRRRLIEHALSTFGGIDLLFVNAGVNPHKGSILDVKEEQWDKTFDVNLKSVFLLIRDVIPHMAKRGGGAIVTNSSATAHVLDTPPSANLPVYAISKMAQIAMLKVLAYPCSDVNIRINAIAPGPVKTNFLTGVNECTLQNVTQDKLLGVFIDRTHGMHMYSIFVVQGEDFSDTIGGVFVKYLKRCAHPEECASVVAFLMSDDASFITGDCVTICGGYSNRL